MNGNERTSLGGRNAQAFIPIITGTLLDGARVGTFEAAVNRAVGTADTSLAHGLGRTPNGVLAYRSSSGGVLYDATSGVTLWTDRLIVLRATVAGTFSFLLI